MYFLYIDNSYVGHAQDIYQLIRSCKNEILPLVDLRAKQITIKDDLHRIHGVGFFDDKLVMRILTLGGVHTYEITKVFQG